MFVFKRSLLVPMLVLAAAACDQGVAAPPISDADYQTAYNKFLQTRALQLVTAGKPNSYTGLRWLKQGTSTVGADTTNAVVLTGRNIPPVIGTLTRTGNAVTFEPARGVAVMIDSAPAVAGTLTPDDGPKPASRVDVGTAGFRIMKRVDSVGVRSWDADRAVTTNVEPLQYFKPDQAWRLGGQFVKRAKPDTQALATSSGVAEVYIDVGTVKTKIDGQPYELTAYAGKDKTDLFFTFSDATSGDETYGFRFFHAPLDTIANTAVIDFNMSYNPDCAFSAYTTCPLPPVNNRITARITAGEKIVKHVGAAKP